MQVLSQHLAKGRRRSLVDPGPVHAVMPVYVAHHSAQGMLAPPPLPC
jgi:hypothetical protein